MEAIRFENVTKKFGNLVANENVSFSVNKGEILSILGENGSGKTTLMNVVAGIYTQDNGKVYINGEEAMIGNPRDAYKYGIGMVHQHFKLVDVLSAVENVVLGLTREDYHHFSQKLVAREERIYEVAEKSGEELTPEEKKELKRHIERSKHFNIKESVDRINAMCKKYGFEIDPYKKVYNMTVSEKQTLEIIKALYRGIDILILDEPTAVLTPQEIKHLFDVLRNMRKDGKTVIIITHKLNEVMEISDRVAILRKGHFIDIVKTTETTEAKLTEMMVGHKIDLNIKRDTPVNPITRLIVRNLNHYNIDGKHSVRNVSFDVRSGEILGIAGISGSGQKELLECIAGLARIDKGDVIFHNPKENKPVSLTHKSLKQVKELAELGTFHYSDGTPVSFAGMHNKQIVELINDKQILFNQDEIMDLKGRNPQQIRDLGIRLSFVPEDRLGMGLVGSMDLVDNMMLRSYRKGRGTLLDRKTPGELTEEIVHELDVATPSVHTQVRKLSGGNIQKVLVGREIAFAPKVFMAAYPVRGLDINSSYTIYELLNKQKQKGTAVIFVGEDLDVLMALCDRILVLSNGAVSGIVDPKIVTKEEIGLLMTKEVVIEEGKDER